MATRKLKTKIDRLEKIVTSLEGDELELEKSLTLFEEGMKLVGECNADLDKAEAKILLLSEDGSETDLDAQTIVDE